MLKETIIVITVLVLIFTAHFVITKYLKTSTNELIGLINEIRENESEDKTENQNENQNKDKDKDKDKKDVSKYSKQSKLDSLEKRWDEIYKIWSIIIVHQELEQIQLVILDAKTAFETGETNRGLIELSKLEFLLENINNRERFRLTNIL